MQAKALGRRDERVHLVLVQAEMDLEAGIGGNPGHHVAKIGHATAAPGVKGVDQNPDRHGKIISQANPKTN